MRQQIRIYSLGAVVGVVSGLVAVGFRWLIFGTSTLFVLVPQLIGIWGWFVIPALGGLLVGLIVQNYAPEAKGHGVPEIMDAYSFRGGRIRMRVPLLKSLASAICIGSGGSCGREGPIAQIGGGVGSTIANTLKLDKRMTKTLVVCGVASGIAATFNAPLGGTLFGIEVIAGGIVGFSIIPVILSSVVATALANALLGSQPSFQAPILFLNNYFELVLYLMLGVLLGVASVIWTRGFYVIEDLYERLKVPKHILPVIGGLMVGLLAMAVMLMEGPFSYAGIFYGNPYFPAIMGVGYAFMDAALIGSVSLAALVIFGLLKALATSMTLGSGGSGGVFAPTLFIGMALPLLVKGLARDLARLGGDTGRVYAWNTWGNVAGALLAGNHEVVLHVGFRPSQQGAAEVKMSHRIVRVLLDRHLELPNRLAIARLAHVLVRKQNIRLGVQRIGLDLLLEQSDGLIVLVLNTVKTSTGHVVALAGYDRKQSQPMVF